MNDVSGFARAVRGIVLVLLTLVVLFAATVAAYRWRGPTEAQRDALASMQQRAPPQKGVNAFPLLWYMRYDVPDGELNARMAAEVEDAKDRLARGSEPFIPEPAARRLEEAAGDASPLCDSDMAGCLDKVAADPRSIREALAAFPTLRAR